MKLKNTHKLPPDQRKRLQAMIDRDGLEVTRKALHISRHAMERAAGGLNIQAGTAALLGQQLDGPEKP